MKQEIHPEYTRTVVRCTCGNEFETRSTSSDEVVNIDVCSMCHPFYTGKQRIVDSGGRVQRFNRRRGKQ